MQSQPPWLMSVIHICYAIAENFLCHKTEPYLDKRPPRGAWEKFEFGEWDALLTIHTSGLKDE